MKPYQQDMNWKRPFRILLWHLPRCAIAPTKKRASRIKLYADWITSDMSPDQSEQTSCYNDELCNQGRATAKSWKQNIILHLEIPRTIHFKRWFFYLSLVWSKTYPAICLSELLCGINLLGPNPIVLADGSEASFNQIVIVFEKMLNVKLGDPQDIKRRVLNRKIHITRFTDALRYALQNYEEK